MVGVHDVANYMLREQSMSAMKLQKLVYYGQAWQLGYHGLRLYQAPIEAWANGPVIRQLYTAHRGKFGLWSWPKGDSDALNDTERDIADLVMATYGTKSANWLSEQTHMEDPWAQARSGLPVGARSEQHIDTGLMRDFYSAQLERGNDPYAAVARP